MEIIKASLEQIPIIQTISKLAWFDTYRDILPNVQIEYMLEMMYSTESLKYQMNNLNHVFLIIYDGTHEQGFISYELNSEGSEKVKVHKLYVLPDSHGKGYGTFLLEYVENTARFNNNKAVVLNMNRNNKALGFYQRLGFKIIKEVDIEIGNGFLMNDYIFEKSL